MNMTYGTGEGKTDFRVRFTLEPSMQVPKGCDGEHCNPRLDVNGSLADRTLTVTIHCLHHLQPWTFLLQKR